MGNEGKISFAGKQLAQTRDDVAVMPAEAMESWPEAGAPMIGEDLPGYLREVYHWCYIDPRNCRFLDREAIVSLILWGQHRRLQRAAFAEIAPGSRVLLPASVYGNFSRALAQHVGARGHLTVSDINPVQLGICRPKIADFPWVSTYLADARHPVGGPFDVTCCYFLLHELPDDYKSSVVDALLSSLAPGGKAVFVDYHKPHGLHPMKPIMSQVFDRLEPFAKALWRKPISAFASREQDFRWRTETLFGGLYQKTVAEPKASAAL